MKKMLSKFGLKKEPFSKDVPVEEFYPAPQLEDAKTRIRSAIKGKTSAVITGDPGTGKTFVLRAVEKDLEGQPYRFEYLSNSALNRRDFYRQLCFALGLEPKASAEGLFRLISEHIEELATTQKIRPVTCFDEAHMLPDAVLSHLPILLNYQRDSKPFLSIVLVGLGDLRRTLSRNIQSALSTRLPVRIHLKPFNFDQTAGYIKHRMKMSGADKEIFTEESLLLIAEATGGAMRKIDILARECLEQAFEMRNALIEISSVKKAVCICKEALI